MGGTIKNFINNEDVTTKHSYIVQSPSDGSDLHPVSAANTDIIENALAAAHAAFPSWRASSFETRQEIFRKAASLLEDRIRQFLDMMEKETFCGPDFSEFNTQSTPAYLRELATSISTMIRTEITRWGDEDVYTHIYRQPYGICLAMAPWNAAMLLAVRAFASPIIAGNTVVFKTSEYSPGTHALFGQLMMDAGLPPGVLNIVHVDAKDAPRLVEQLIADKRVRHVNFTGSTRVGSIVGSLAGKHIKPCILELGGKAPAIVLADADLDVAASHCILGAWLHQGQICMSTEKVIVLTPVYKTFVERLNRIASSSGIRSSPLGLQSLDNARRSQELIDEAIRHGAVPIMGDHLPRDERHVAPCILTKVTKEMRIYSEETFAPVFIVLEAVDEDEAIALANDTDYGLSSSIFSADVSKALEMGLKLETGATHLNGMTVYDHPATPHGGMKASGFGRFNGAEGIGSFLQTKVVTVRSKGHAIPL